MDLKGLLVALNDHESGLIDNIEKYIPKKIYHAQYIAVYRCCDFYDYSLGTYHTKEDAMIALTKILASSDYISHEIINILENNTIEQIKISFLNSHLSLYLKEGEEILEKILDYLYKNKTLGYSDIRTEFFEDFPCELFKIEELIYDINEQFDKDYYIERYICQEIEL